MTARTAGIGIVALGLVLLAFVPRLGNAYQLALAISLLQYTVLATAWAMFSGPTRYVSLATTAFFGVGAYTVAVLGEALPWPAGAAVAAGIGSVLAFALIVGLSTLRLCGVYFVIFTFGPDGTDPPAGELVRDQQSRRASAVTSSSSITPSDIYWQLAGAHRRCVPARLADRALAARPCATRHRRRRDGGTTLRHRYHLAKVAMFAISAPL